MMRLDEELDSAGCRTAPDEFRRIVREMFGDRFAAWTDEDLLCRPREAEGFCNLVRRRVRCEEVSDYVILRTLTNTRKRGDAAPDA